MNILLSYSHLDASFSRTLKRALERFDIEVWLDEHEITIGDSIPDRLRNLIWKCDFLIVVISPRSLNSKWVQWELAVAQQREQSEGVVRILPLLMQGEHVPSLLANRLYADFRTNERQQANFKNLLNMLLGQQSGDRSPSPQNMDLFKPQGWEDLHVPTRIEELMEMPSVEFVNSPIVGTVYLSPSPEADPYVTVGDRVQKGQVILLIEAMKLFNEIESTLTGTVVEILCQDMLPVEYDEPLVAIDVDE